MARTRFAAILPLFLVVAAYCPAAAQQAGASACDVPVVAVQLDPQTHALDLVTDFTATDFTATQGGHGVHVNSATIDTTPKRIVFVFDASKRVDKTQWNVQFQLAGTLLANSRSGDNFSIFLTPGTPLPFVSSDESRAALQRLMAARPKVAEKRNPIYDSLFAASKIFGAPRFGDSIVLIGFREDAKSKNKPDYVLGALIQGGIRLHTIDIADSGDLPYRSEFTVPGRSPLLIPTRLSSSRCP